MAWQTLDPTRTLHAETCNMSFGRKDATCPRCKELLAGDSPRKGWSDKKRRQEQQQLEAIRNHDCKKAGCMIVCTFGDW